MREALQFATEEMQGDREVVMSAFRPRMGGLCNLEEMQGDREV